MPIEAPCPQCPRHADLMCAHKSFDAGQAKLFLAFRSKVRHPPPAAYSCVRAVLLVRLQPPLLAKPQSQVTRDPPTLPLTMITTRSLSRWARASS
eukprot:COSAG01_NODE_8014_length_2953_cov_14.818851_2_plen_95_part_00